MRTWLFGHLKTFATRFLFVGLLGVLSNTVWAACSTSSPIIPIKDASANLFCSDYMSVCYQPPVYKWDGYFNEKSLYCDTPSEAIEAQEIPRFCATQVPSHCSRANPEGTVCLEVTISTYGGLKMHPVGTDANGICSTKQGPLLYGSTYNRPFCTLGLTYIVFLSGQKLCEIPKHLIPPATIPPPPPEPIQACGVGNPVILGSGEKLHTETDLTLAGAHPLSFSRYYRSRYAVLPKDMASLGLGAQWMHNYQANLKIEAGKITATRPDSSYALFNRSGTGWAANPLSNQNAADTLIPVLDRGTAVGYSYKVFDTDAVELYDLTGKLISITERNGWRTTLNYSTAATPASTAPAAGLLIQVTNHFGRSIKLAYNASKQLSKVTDPLGQSISYAYNAALYNTGMLTQVTRQDNKTRQYHYEQTNTPWGITGITDELGVRYATYAYDAQGRVASESKVGNVDVANITYAVAPDYTTTVQHSSPSGSLLSQTTIGFTNIGGRYQPTGSNAPSALCAGYAQSINYDTVGRKASELTHDGKHIAYSYDTKGRQLSRTERVGSATGAITYKATTAYHPTFNLPINSLS